VCVCVSKCACLFVCRISKIHTYQSRSVYRWSAATAAIVGAASASAAVAVVSAVT
jgi:hypothetical protein